MDTGRLEAFSDGVIAIIITIMVLELDVPEEMSVTALADLAPTLLSYLMSYIYVGIFWINHHHLLSVTEKVNGQVLWSNLHLLFWLSLIPFVTSWVDEDVQLAIPVAFYGLVLLLCALAYVVLQNAIVKIHDDDFILRGSIRRDHKYKVVFIYAFGIAVSFWSTWLAIVCYVLVAIIWVIPEKRLEEFNDNA